MLRYLWDFNVKGPQIKDGSHSTEIQSSISTEAFVKLK